MGPGRQAVPDPLLQGVARRLIIRPQIVQKPEPVDRRLGVGVDREVESVEREERRRGRQHLARRDVQQPVVAGDHLERVVAGIRLQPARRRTGGGQVTHGAQGIEDVVNFALCGLERLEWRWLLAFRVGPPLCVFQEQVQRRSHRGFVEVVVGADGGLIRIEHPGVVSQREEAINQI
jgi:hypothetical protein